MKIKKQHIISLLLLLVGVFCQTQPLMSRGVSLIYTAICIFLFIITIDIKRLKVGIGFFWYLAFTLFCMFSLTYTINKINPDFVYRRIIVYLLLLFLVTPFFEEKNNIKTTVKGFIIGGIIGISIVLFNQYNLIGITRLGPGIYGSAAEFGNTCMLTLASFIWLRKHFIKNKILRLLTFIFIIIGTILSGARKAILVPLLMMIFLQLLDRRKKMTKKVIMLLLMAVVSISIVYASLNNEYLYKYVGYRIESGISSVLGKDSEDASLQERGSFKVLAIDMFKEKPIYGWGMHSFAIKNYYYHNSTIYLLYSHDGFLEILSCYGIIGFLLFYWIFVYILCNYKKMLYDDIGVFLFSYTIIILLMEPYSICFLNSYYILLIGAAANTIMFRRKQDEKSD